MYLNIVKFWMNNHQAQNGLNGIAFSVVRPLAAVWSLIPWSWCLVTQYSCQLFWLAPSRFNELFTYFSWASPVAALTEAALALLFASPWSSCLITVVVAKFLNLSVFSLLSHGFSLIGFFLVVSLFFYLSFSSLACLTSKASAASGLVFRSSATSASSSRSLWTSSGIISLSSGFFSSFFAASFLAAATLAFSLSSSSFFF